VAGQNDFTLSFGSNASQFAQDLIADLAPVRGEIASIAGLLKALPALAAQQGAKAADALADSGVGDPITVEVNTAATKPAAAPPKARVVPASQGGLPTTAVTGRTGPGARSVREQQADQAARAAAQPGISPATQGTHFDVPDFTGMVESIKSLNQEIAGIVGKAEALVRSMQPITKAVADEREHEARRRGALEAGANRTRNSLGHMNPAGVDGRPFISVPAGPSSPLPQRHISEVTNVQIDDAAFERLTSAVLANTEATNVNTAVMRARGGGHYVPDSAREAAAPVGAPPTAAGTLKNQLSKRQRVTAIQEEIARVKSGGEFNPELFGRVAGTTRKIHKQGAETGYAGDRYLDRLNKSLEQLNKDLQGVPDEAALRSMLKDVEARNAAAAAAPVATAASEHVAPVSTVPATAHAPGAAAAAKAEKAVIKEKIQITKEEQEQLDQLAAVVEMASQGVAAARAAIAQGQADMVKLAQTMAEEGNDPAMVQFLNERKAAIEAEIAANEGQVSAIEANAQAAREAIASMTQATQAMAEAGAVTQQAAQATVLTAEQEKEAAEEKRRAEGVARAAFKKSERERLNMTRAEYDEYEKEKRRAEARTAALARGDQSLDPFQRRNVRRDLDMGASEDALRGKGIFKQDLVRVAKSFAGEGYGQHLGFNPESTSRVTNDKLIAGIMKASAAMEEAAGKTFHDLENAAKEATEIPHAVRLAAQEFVNEIRLSSTDKEAYEIRRADRRSGGFGDDNFRGRQQYGGDFQQGDDFRLVQMAQEHIAKRNTEQIPQAAADAARRNIQKGRNIFAPGFGQGIQGKDEEANAYRRALRQTQTATRVIDELVDHFDALPAAIGHVEKEIAELTEASKTLDTSGSFKNAEALRDAQYAMHDSITDTRLAELNLAKVRRQVAGQMRTKAFLPEHQKQLEGIDAELGAERLKRQQLNDRIKNVPLGNLGDRQKLADEWKASQVRTQILGRAKGGLRLQRMGGVQEAAGPTEDQAREIAEHLKIINDEDARRKQLTHQIATLTDGYRDQEELQKKLLVAQSRLLRLTNSLTNLSEGEGHQIGEYSRDPKYRTGRVARERDYREANKDLFEDDGTEKRGDARIHAMDERSRAQRASEAAERQARRYAARVASADALAGARTRQGARAGGVGGAFANFTRGLPGLKPTDERSSQYGQLRAINPLAVDPRILKRINAALRDYQNKIIEIGELTDEQKADDELVAKLKGQQVNSLRKLVNAYNSLNLQAKEGEAGLRIMISDQGDVSYRQDLGAKATPKNLVRSQADLKKVQDVVAGDPKIRSGGALLAALRADNTKISKELVKRATDLARVLGQSIETVLGQTLREVGGGGAGRRLAQEEKESEYRKSQPKAVRQREADALLEGQAPPERGDVRGLMEALGITVGSMEHLVGVTHQAREAFAKLTAIVKLAEKAEAERVRAEIATTKAAVEAAGGASEHELVPLGGGDAKKQLAPNNMAKLIEELRKNSAGQALLTRAENRVAEAERKRIEAPQAEKAGMTVPSLEQAIQEIVNPHLTGASEKQVSSAEAYVADPTKMANYERAGKILEELGEEGRTAVEAIRANRQAAEELAAAERAAAEATTAATSATQAAREANAPANEAAATQGLQIAAQQNAARQVGGKSTNEQITRNQLRNDQNLIEVKRRLSASTLGEIDELKRLVKERASEAQIAEQQIKVYAAMHRELTAEPNNFNTNAVRQGFRAVSTEAGAAPNQTELNSVTQSAGMRGLLSGSGRDPKEATGALDQFVNKLFGKSGFWGRIANSTGTFIIRNFTAGIVFGVSSALSDIIRQGIETESTFVRVSQALESTGRDAGNLRTQLQGISTQYGVALEDVYTTAAGLTGVFQDVGDVAMATKVAAQLELISNGALNATEAMRSLASITSGFSTEVGGADGLEHVADVLTVIQNRIGVNIEDVAEGTSRLSGLAQQVGLSFEQTAVFVSEISKKTGQTGMASGEQLQRIIAVMQSGRGQKVLNDTFAGTGIDNALTNGDYGAAIELVMKNYEKLNPVQQQNLNITLGGQRQAAAIAALFKDGADALDIVRAATDSKGEADKRANQIINNLNTAMKKFKSNLVNLGAALVRSGLLDFFGVLLIAVNDALAGLNHLLSVVNDIAESSPFLSFLSKATIALIGMGLALKVLKAGFAGFKAFAKESPAVVAAVNAASGGGKAAAATAAAAAAAPAPSKLTNVPFGNRYAAAALQAEQAAAASAAAAAEREAAAATVRGRTRQALMNAGTTSVGQVMPLGWSKLRAGTAGLPLPTSSSNLLSKGLEKVVAGPMKAFGGGLTKLAAMLESLAIQQAAAGLGGRAAGEGVELAGGAAGRTAFLARRAEGLANFSSRGGTAVQMLLRGRPDYVAQQAAASLRGVAERRAQSAALASSGLGGQGALAGIKTGILSKSAAAALGASNALERLALSLSKVNLGGVAAAGGLAALGVGIIAVVMEINRSKQFSKDYEKAYEAKFGSGRGKTQDQIDKEQYVGPADELFKKNQKDFNGGITFGRDFRAMGTMLNPGNFGRIADFKNPLTDGSGSLIHDIQSLFGTANDRASGNASIENFNKNDKSWRGGLKKITGAAENATGDLPARIKAVRDASQSAQDDLAKRAEEIEQSSDSPEQKATLQADLEKASKNIEDITAKEILKIQGLNKFSKMTTERIQELSGFADMLAQTPGAGNYTVALEALMNKVNPAAGGDGMARAFKVLGTAGNSTAERISAQIQVTNQLIDAESANLNSLTDPDEIKASQQNLMSLMSAVEGQKRQLIDAEVASANELATFMTGAGNYAGAGAQLQGAADKLRAQVAASRAQRDKDAKNPGNLLQRLGVTGDPNAGKGFTLPRADIIGTDEEQAKLNLANQLASTAVDDMVTGANRDNQLAADKSRNDQTIADLQVTMAKERARQFHEAFALGNKTQAEVDSADKDVITALNNQADTGQAKTQAKFALTSAGLLNNVAKSRNDEAAAWQAVSYARSQFGKDSTQYTQALTAATAASQATTQSVLDEQAALRETQLAMIAPSDVMGRANKTLSNALAAQRDAARFGQSSVQYQQATQAVIEAQRGVDQAILDIATANTNLAVALANAAGKTVEAAQYQLAQAQADLDAAKKKSGGARSPDVINAEAAVATANASVRDAQLQTALDTIDFQKSMDQITSQGAISMLTELLNMKDLTEQQRRDILLRIKGLQDELSSSLQGAFNLPETIKPPTVYEVRRALGIDDFLKSMKDATDVSAITGSGASGSSANQILREIQDGLAKNNGSAVPTQSQDYSNSNNNVTINGASFDDVIAWLQQYLGSGAQVVRTVSPRKVY
jgi:hypothetical protein